MNSFTSAQWVVFTGVYILMKGDLESKDIIKMVTEMFEFVVTFEGEIPGNMAKDCGNHLDHNMLWPSMKQRNI